MAIVLSNCVLATPLLADMFNCKTGSCMMRL
jgi:hypothetical protein